MLDAVVIGKGDGKRQLRGPNSGRMKGNIVYYGNRFTFQYECLLQL